MTDQDIYSSAIKVGDKPSSSSKFTTVTPMPLSKKFTWLNFTPGMQEVLSPSLHTLICVS